MADNQYIKDPDGVLDYGIDWSSWLGDDTIASSDWMVPTGITEVDDDDHPTTNTTTTTTIWLSGGTSGVTYRIVNHIVTAAGREDDRSIYIRVADK